MWGPSTAPLSRHNSVIAPQSMYATERKYCSSNSDPLRSLSEMNSAPVTSSSTEHKWGVGAIIKGSLGVISDPGLTGASAMHGGTNGNVPTTPASLHHTIEHHNSTSAAAQSVLENSAIAAAATAKYLQNYHHPSSVSMGMTMGVGGTEQGSASEVWVYPPPTHQWVASCVLFNAFRFVKFPICFPKVSQFVFPASDPHQILSCFLHSFHCGPTHSSYPTHSLWELGKSCFNWLIFLQLFGGRYLLPYGDKSDRSPLLSISEVTNTLLNHEWQGGSNEVKAKYHPTYHDQRSAVSWGTWVRNKYQKENDLKSYYLLQHNPVYISTQT